MHRQTGGKKLSCGAAIQLGSIIILMGEVQTSTSSKGERTSTEALVPAS